MASINFYLHLPYKKGVSLEKINKLKAQSKPVGTSLLNDKETRIYLCLTLPKATVKQSKAKLIRAKTDFKILPKYWDFNSKLPTDKAPGGLELKAELNQIKGEVLAAYITAIKNTAEISVLYLEKIVQSIVSREQGIINTNDLYTLFEDYISTHPKIKTERTRQKLRTLIKCLKGFEETKKYQINFSSINREFHSKFLKYLESEIHNPKSGEKGFLNNTINKYFSDLKTFLEYAYKEKYHRNEYFKDLTTTRDEVEPVSLEIEEFKLLLNHTPSSDALKETKDAFIAECLTAQRYEDMDKLRWEDIRNNTWHLFQSKGRKTRVLEIPLHPLVVNILDARKGQFKPLPVISNQKYNDNIKDLCKEAGITETYTRVRYSGDKPIKEVGPKYSFISSHTGRKTFQNIAPEFGIPIEVAMSISGSKDVKVIMAHYRKISLKEKEKAINAMDFNANLKVV